MINGKPENLTRRGKWEAPSYQKAPLETEDNAANGPRKRELEVEVGLESSEAFFPRDAGQHIF